MAESPQPTMQKRTISLKSFSGETCSSQSDLPTGSSLPAFTVTSPLFPLESKTRFLPPIHYLDPLSDSRVQRLLPFGFETALVEEFRGSKRCAEPRPAAAGQPPLRPALPPRVRNRNHALKTQEQSGDRSVRRISSRAHPDCVCFRHIRGPPVIDFAAGDAIDELHGTLLGNSNRRSSCQSSLLSRSIQRRPKRRRDGHSQPGDTATRGLESSRRESLCQSVFSGCGRGECGGLVVEEPLGASEQARPRSRIPVQRQYAHHH